MLINRGDTLLDVSMGCDGDWFLRTNQTICGCRLTSIPHIILSLTQNNYHLGWKARSANFLSQTVQAFEHAQKYNIDLPNDQIMSVTFVPSSNGCICIGQASDGTTTCLWRGAGVPPSLAGFLGDVPRTNPVQSVSVGADSAWVVVLQNGAVYFEGISENLRQKLQLASGVLVRVFFFFAFCPKGGPSLIASYPQSVTLSLSNPEEYLINYANGDSDCRLESRWLAAVSAETQRCVYQRRSVYSAASNMGDAALLAQTRINESVAAGSAAVLDAIW